MRQDYALDYFLRSSRKSEADTWLAKGCITETELQSMPEGLRQKVFNRMMNAGWRYYQLSGHYMPWTNM